MMVPRTAPILERDNCTVIGSTTRGETIRGILVQASPFECTAQFFLAPQDLQVSEVLRELKVLQEGRIYYSGRGVLKNLSRVSSEVYGVISLDQSFEPLDADETIDHCSIGGLYKSFFATWQKRFQIETGYKLLIADLQSYLTDLRSWLDNVESRFRSEPSFSREKEVALLRALEKDCLRCLNRHFDAFEAKFKEIDPQQHAAYRIYARRHLHPLLLCAPFVYRTYFKPLGYAGDYEMVNMIVRNSYEGESWFAKIVHKWFTNQAPAIAHRNRIEHIKRRMVDEGARVSRRRSGLRVLNLGCGPAAEISQFLHESPLSDSAQFTLYDFNDEAIAYAQSMLNDAKRQAHRQTQLTIQKKSVQQILKEAGRAASVLIAPTYDFIYCAGLFDYFPDAICRRILAILYGFLAPGGLLLVTNVDHSTPRRYGMESILEWNLIYRNTTEFLKLLPPEISNEDPILHTELSGVNLILEVRKPNHD